MITWAKMKKLMFPRFKQTTNLAFAAGVSANVVIARNAETNPYYVRVTSTADVYVAFGNEDIAAAATDMIIPAGCVEFLELVGGRDYIAANGVAGAGVISVTEVE
jgi:hypothetical protein